jgi:uncharacterized membrane protein YfcA
LRRGRTKGPWSLFLFLMAGIIVGSTVGSILAKYSDAELFQQSFTLGTQGMPAVLDLIVIKLSFGLSLTINFGTMLGILIGILLYYRY